MYKRYIRKIRKIIIKGDNMNKEMTEYKKKHYLGGTTKSGKFRHNLIADKLLKMPIYSRFYSNRKLMNSITWDTEKFNDEFRICSGKERNISDIARICDIRQISLDKKGWIENPSGMPKIPNSVKKLKSHKRVKFRK